MSQVDPSVQNLESHLYNYLTNVVAVDVLLKNLYTMHVQNETNATITDTNEALTKSWTTDGITGDLLTAWQTATGTTGQDWISHMTTNPNADTAKIMYEFLTGTGPFKTADQYGISDFSISSVTALINVFAASIPYNDDLKNNQSSYNTQLNSLNSWANTTSGAEEGIGTNNEKVEQSIIQTTPNSGQTLSNINDSWQQVLANMVRLLGQTYPA